MKTKLFSKEECDGIIQYCEDIDKWDIVVGEGLSYKIVLYPSQGNTSEKIIKYVEDNLKLKVLNPNIAVIKYFEGDFFGRHYDRKPSSEFNKDFLYNVNLRLNDNYEGGQFYLRDEPFYAEVGDVYHYKSSDWHEVKPVTNGVKYTALFYIRERDLVTNKII